MKLRNGRSVVKEILNVKEMGKERKINDNRTYK
jgi:hypothetical protein